MDPIMFKLAEIRQQEYIEKSQRPIYDDYYAYAPAHSRLRESLSRLFIAIGTRLHQPDAFEDAERATSPQVAQNCS